MAALDELMPGEGLQLAVRLFEHTIESCAFSGTCEDEELRDVALLGHRILRQGPWRGAVLLPPLEDDQG